LFTWRAGDPTHDVSFLLQDEVVDANVTWAEQKTVQKACAGEC
jgi:hypothetical protein